MSIADACKVKALIFDFTGDVLNEIYKLQKANFRFSEKLPCELTASVKNIEKFCEDVRKKLEDLAGYTEFSFDDESIQENFKTQIKAIKKICERNFDKII